MHFDRFFHVPLSYWKANTWVTSPFTIFAFSLIKQIDSMLLQLCTVINHRGCQNMLRRLSCNQLVPDIPAVSKTQHNSEQCCHLPHIFTPLLLSHLFCFVFTTECLEQAISCILCANFLFSPYSDITCDLLLNRCTAKWNLYYIYSYSDFLYHVIEIPTSCLYFEIQKLFSF